MKPFISTLAVGYLLTALISQAEAAIEISPAAFSGSETVVTFGGLSAIGVTSLTTPEGVTFSTADASPNLTLKFDSTSGRTGPSEQTGLDNISGPAPYPDVDILFPSLVNRVGLDLRTNNPDATVDFTLSLMSNGNVVDAIQIVGNGFDSTVFEFYGFETNVGFDAVLIDVPENSDGAFRLDNLRFENSLGNAPVPEPTALLVWGGLACCVAATKRRR